jgi:hypothetical protein
VGGGSHAGRRTRRFALRYIDQMELTQMAEACGASLASIKRRLARAESRFSALARRFPALAPYLEGGPPWNRRCPDGFSCIDIPTEDDSSFVVPGRARCLHVQTIQVHWDPNDK